MKKENKYLLFGISMLTLVVIIKQLFSSYSRVYEVLYLNGLYRLIRLAYDYLIGSWLPVPMVIFSIILILYLIFIRKTKVQGFLANLKLILGYIAILLSSFYILWGWNYAQQGVASKLGIKNHINADSLQLIKEADWAIFNINAERTYVQNDTFPLLNLDLNNKEIESEIRTTLVNSLQTIGFPTYGRPRVRVVKPKGILMRWKTAGIYFPYAFEGHIDDGLMEYEKPFTMAHEMSHGYGITDEGECNFTAFLACMSTDNHLFRYSAMIDYTLYVLRDLYRLDPSLHKKYYSRLNKGVRKDFREMRKNNDKYPDILPNVRDVLYESYLKSNGVSAGLASYSQLVSLVIQWKEISEHE